MSEKRTQDTDPADQIRTGRAARPKLSATLLLLRNHQGQQQCLMGKRSMRHRFMPGKFVFPGGKVDAHDANAPIATALCPRVLAHMRPFLPARRIHAAAAAAIRETYEETGLKLAKQTPKIKGTIPTSFAAFSDNQLGLDLGALSVLARAITPPYHPKRFDTWFFTAHADQIIDDPNDQASGELEELQWINPAETDALDLPMITRAVLQDLHQQTPDTPIAFYHTKHRKHIRTIL